MINLDNRPGVYGSSNGDQPMSEDMEMIVRATNKRTGRDLGLLQDRIQDSFQESPASTFPTIRDAVQGRTGSGGRINAVKSNG